MLKRAELGRRPGLQASKEGKFASPGKRKTQELSCTTFGGSESPYLDLRKTKKGKSEKRGKRDGVFLGERNTKVVGGRGRRERVDAVK